MLALDALLGGRARHGESLARRSSLRIGGEADHWVEPASLDELIEVCELATAHELPIHVVGLGSNTLFPDEGLRGITIRMSGELATWQVLGEEEGVTRVRVGAGLVNAHLVRGVLASGLVGAEFLVLIPGTFGGEDCGDDARAARDALPPRDPARRGDRRRWHHRASERGRRGSLAGGKG
jgi:UDP-N-acetylmuramate dehydrogenase